MAFREAARVLVETMVRASGNVLIWLLDVCKTHSGFSLAHLIFTKVLGVNPGKIGYTFDQRPPVRIRQNNHSSTRPPFWRSPSNVLPKADIGVWNLQPVFPFSAAIDFKPVRHNCSYGQPKEIRLCPITECALWPYRSGKRPITENGSPTVEEPSVAIDGTG